MDMEEGGKIVEINVVEGEECMAGQIIAVLVEDKEPEQML
jgi:multidrug efflux pump subunit AcrA (membrane-fusion protein)|tara:strand:- start:358 stop:477 length:120 start_codon:yes stop_codon:yes gene_type:complete